MIPAAPEDVVAVALAIAAVAFDVAADQFSMPFVHMRAIHCFD